MRSTHSGRLERWLGTEALAHVSTAMDGWYGPPILVGGVPGGVHATGDGDFVGPIRGGGFASFADYAAEQLVIRQKRAMRGYRRWAEKQQRMYSAGFSSLSDLIAEATAGKKLDFLFQKAGTTGVVAATNSLWRVGNQPAAGAAAAAAPGGTVPTSATTGALPYTNPASGDTLHFVRADVSTSAVGTLLLYDRLFAVAKTMSSTAAQAVTGTPSRYTNTTSGQPDSAAGNFLFIECGTALSSTAHNWTVCTYTDQNGNTGATLPSVTGNSGNIVNRLDMPTSTWFCPLASGDTGINSLTQMQCSASVTGAIDFVIGHPIVILPVNIANMVSVISGINSEFSLTRIFDDACLAFLELTKPATTAATYNGMFTAVAG